MDKHNPVAFYAFVNERQVFSESIGALRKSAGTVKSSNADISNILNDYVVSVFTNDGINNIPQVELYEEMQPLEYINFSVNALLEQLNKLNIYISLGPEYLYPWTLKSLGVHWWRYSTEQWEMEGSRLLEESKHQCDFHERNQARAG